MDLFSFSIGQFRVFKPFDKFYDFVYVCKLSINKYQGLVFFQKKRSAPYIIAQPSYPKNGFKTSVKHRKCQWLICCRKLQSLQKGFSQCVCSKFSVILSIFLGIFRGIFCHFLSVNHILWSVNNSIKTICLAVVNMNWTFDCDSRMTILEHEALVMHA